MDLASLTRKDYHTDNSLPQAEMDTCITPKELKVFRMLPN